MLIKQIYSMVVCFVTTIVILVTLSMTLKEFITLFLPEYIDEEMVKYSTNEQYLKIQSYDNEQRLRGLPPKELEEKRIIYKNEYIEVTKARAISTIINCSIWIIVSFIFFIIHWKIYKNTQNNNN